VKVFLARMQWWAWALLGVLLAAGIFFLKLISSRPKEPLPSVYTPPPEIQARVEKAEETALRARVEARVTAEHQRQELEHVAKIPEGALRRKRLAELLRRL